MPDADPRPAPSPAAPAAPVAPASSAWGLWSAVGWVVLLAAAALALATGSRALGDALDVGRWFR